LHVWHYLGQVAQEALPELVVKKYPIAHYLQTVSDVHVTHWYILEMHLTHCVSAVE